MVYFRFQDFRSTRAAGAAPDGVWMSQIQAALGHSSVSITEKHYAQIHPEYREKAREHSKKTYKSHLSHMEKQNDIKILFYLFFMALSPPLSQNKIKSVTWLSDQFFVPISYPDQVVLVSGEICRCYR